MENYTLNKQVDDNNLKKLLLRYISFWQYYLISIILFLIGAFLYLRYANYTYRSVAKIEIIDKAQDSEMALPTAMTIFNRSMINLENEIGVLSSYSLHKKVVNNLDFNVEYISIGSIKSSKNHPSEWFGDFDLRLNFDADTINKIQIFDIDLDKNKLTIDHYAGKDEEFISSYNFDNLTTLSKNSDLPFELTINDEINEKLRKKLIIRPVNDVIENCIKNSNILVPGKDSDQLSLTFTHNNILIADEYLNTLISEFDRDGIVDRQMEYLNTMDFVDTRSDFLSAELQKVEQRKQNFKEENNLSDIQVDGSINVNQKFTYNSELFSAMSQKDLVLMLKDAAKDNFLELIPVNIGLENIPLNQVISEFNLLVKEYNQFLTSAGKNHPYLKKLEYQLEESYNNVSLSIRNYEKSLDLTINNLKLKEDEFSDVYRKIPENEKILRSIERELEIKESLFLLLLQKREEAAINYAVIRPSIKIIDSARTLLSSKSPNSFLLLFGSILMGLFAPTFIIYLIFYFDNKIHTKADLKIHLNEIPVIGEIPFIRDVKETKVISNSSSRSMIAESVRMIMANLNFTLFQRKDKKMSNTILVTSSIKGEGKTLVSVNLASILSKKGKVLLLGADLRNPQIHKFLNISKSQKGLSDYIYLNDFDWKNHLQKHENLDILLSGTIPPNPTELVSSDKFKDFLNEIKKMYDYIIIDSAPCLLVSDTFEISPLVDLTICVVRSNFSEIKLCDFINECKKANRLSNLNIVLNGVGNSQMYGYKYGYQYGYKYGYKYGYNYGYGYGYSEDKN